MGYYDPPEYDESERDYECEGTIENDKGEEVPCGYEGLVTRWSQGRYSMATGECPKCGKSIEIEDEGEDPDLAYDRMREDRLDWD